MEKSLNVSEIQYDKFQIQIQIRFRSLQRRGWSTVPPGSVIPLLSYAEEMGLEHVLEVLLSPGNVERELQTEHSKGAEDGCLENCKAFTSVALTARVATGVAIRPCGWGWISISGI